VHLANGGDVVRDLFKSARRSKRLCLDGTTLRQKSSI
jgi:hypothetical protein